MPQPIGEDGTLKVSTGFGDTATVVRRPLALWLRCTVVVLPAAVLLCSIAWALSNRERGLRQFVATEKGASELSAYLLGQEMLYYPFLGKEIAKRRIETILRRQHMVKAYRFGPDASAVTFEAEVVDWPYKEPYVNGALLYSAHSVIVPCMVIAIVCLCCSSIIVGLGGQSRISLIGRALLVGVGTLPAVMLATAGFGLGVGLAPLAFGGIVVTAAAVGRNACHLTALLLAINSGGAVVFLIR